MGSEGVLNNPKYRSTLGERLEKAEQTRDVREPDPPQQEKEKYP